MALLIEGLVKFSFVLAMGLAAMPFLKRRSAAFRHWVLIAALAAAAAQPLLSLSAPRWTLPSSGWLTASDVGIETSLVLLRVEPQADGGEHPVGPLDTASFGGSRLMSLLLAVWAGGTLITVFTLVTGFVRLTRITARADDAPHAWQVAARDVSRALGLRRVPRPLVTDRPALLVTWGIRRPVVLLPREATSWSPDRIRAVVSHELAHVLRRDWLTQLGVEVVRALGWFHPLLWLTSARLRHESEQACDDLVLGLGIERTAYATHLVALARAFSTHRRTWLPAPAAVRSSTLQWRIRAMLNRSLDRRPVSMSARTAILVAMLCASLSLPGLHAQTTSVSGTLRDASGRALAGATVRLADTQSDAKFDTQSDQSGQFQFTAVAPGSYALSARHVGFSPIVESVALTDGASVRRELTMQVGSVQETISVRGGGPADGRKVLRQEVPFVMPACTPSSEGGQIVPPTKIRHVPPQYPQHLQSANVTGTILLLAQIGPDGVVHDVRSLSYADGDPGLEEAAIVAVKQWRFTPTLLNCQPVGVQMLVTVTFSMTA
jgi:TonB family protein